MFEISCSENDFIPFSQMCVEYLLEIVCFNNRHFKSGKWFVGEWRLKPHGMRISGELNYKVKWVYCLVTQAIF